MTGDADYAHHFLKLCDSEVSDVSIRADSKQLILFASVQSQRTGDCMRLYQELLLVHQNRGQGANISLLS